MAKFVVTNNRLSKARKINNVICDSLGVSELKGMKVLDIGCGTGEIISYFNRNNNEVFAVDTLNQLKKNVKIKNLIIVNTANLPFENEYFDIILSNHVVEHIPEQNVHMSEINRCLKPNGICYYATPNKNYFQEPHHKIPVIHYFGFKTFHRILKWLGKFEEEIYLLSYSKMKSSFKKNNFNFIEYTAKIIKCPDKFALNFKLLKYIPFKLLCWFQWMSPTNIFILKKK
jgi:ubiquinone/menaquinone biosynthesis C-methylase UbiE